MEESSRLRGGVAISFDQEVGKEVDKVGEVMDIGQGGEWGKLF